MRHVRGQLVGRGFRHAVIVLPMYFCAAHTLMLTISRCVSGNRCSSKSGTARELTVHAARTPASVMLVQRCEGYCQKGSGQVNWPLSIIRSYPLHALLTTRSSDDVVRRMCANAASMSASSV